MKVAVLVGRYSENAGGAKTYVNIITRELIKISSNSEIDYVFFSGFHKIKNLQLIDAPRSAGRISKKIRLLTKFLKDISMSLFLNNAYFVALYRRICSFVLNRIMRSHKIDFVWSTYPLSFPLKIPFATTVWDLQHRTQPYWPEFTASNNWQIRDSAFKKVLPLASLIISGTKCGADDINFFYQIPKERIIVASFPIIEIKNQHDKVRNPNLFFYPAQFWPHKNHVNLILGFKLAMGVLGTEMKLVLPGSDKGNKSYVEETVKKLDLGENVILPGFISHGELIDLYQTANGLIFPSYFGPDNLPPMEGLAYGCSVAVADIKGAKENFNLFDYYFDPSSPEDICNAILYLREKPMRSKVNGVNNKDMSFNDRSPAKIIDKIEREILKLDLKFRNWNHD